MSIVNCHHCPSSPVFLIVRFFLLHLKVELLHEPSDPHPGGHGGHFNKGSGLDGGSGASGFQYSRLDGLKSSLGLFNECVERSYRLSQRCLLLLSAGHIRLNYVLGNIGELTAFRGQRED